MELLLQTLAFAAKGFIVFLVIAASAAVLFRLGRRRGFSRPRLEVKALNARFEALADRLRDAVLDRKDLKAHYKQRAKPPRGGSRQRVYVLDFEGDILATAVEKLREEVTAVSEVARPEDEVVVKIESGGGAVPHYGFAAAQLKRLRDKQLKVTACIDRVAASGGYMMACVADRIVAAPFAVIGSIGVVAPVPNLHRLLKKHDVDFEEATAGEFKRTVSLFGEITSKGRAKLQEQLEETHLLFKGFVKEQRPALDVDKVATGEYWLATKALELKLVDELGTSDDYLLSRSKESDVYRVSFKPEHPWRTRLGIAVAEALERAALRVLARLQGARLLG